MSSRLIRSSLHPWQYYESNTVSNEKLLQNIHPAHTMKIPEMICECWFDSYLQASIKWKWLFKLIFFVPNISLDIARLPRNPNGILSNSKHIESYLKCCVVSNIKWTVERDSEFVFWTFDIWERLFSHKEDWERVKKHSFTTKFKDLTLSKNHFSQPKSETIFFRSSSRKPQTHSFHVIADRSVTKMSSFLIGNIVRNGKKERKLYRKNQSTECAIYFHTKLLVLTLIFSVFSHSTRHLAFLFFRCNGISTPRHTHTKEPQC